MGYEEVSEEDWLHMLRDVVDGLVYAHSLGIAHRDVKSENILFEVIDDRRSVKLIDWGLAKTRADRVCNLERCGTPHYTAPEVLDTDNKEGYVAMWADVWSLGVLFYEVFREGTFPFKGRTAAEVFTSIQRGTYKQLTEDDCKNPVIRSLVRSMLINEPHDRPTMKFILARMPKPPSLVPPRLHSPPSQLNSKSTAKLSYYKSADSLSSDEDLPWSESSFRIRGAGHSGAPLNSRISGSPGEPYISTGHSFGNLNSFLHSDPDAQRNQFLPTAGLDTDTGCLNMVTGCPNIDTKSAATSVHGGGAGVLGKAVVDIGVQVELSDVNQNNNNNNNNNNDNNNNRISNSTRNNQDTDSDVNQNNSNNNNRISSNTRNNHNTRNSNDTDAHLPLPTTTHERFSEMTSSPRTRAALQASKRTPTTTPLRDTPAHTHTQVHTQTHTQPYTNAHSFALQTCDTENGPNGLRLSLTEGTKYSQSSDIPERLQQAHGTSGRGVGADSPHGGATSTQANGTTGAGTNQGANQGPLATAPKAKACVPTPDFQRTVSYTPPTDGPVTARPFSTPTRPQETVQRSSHEYLERQRLQRQHINEFLKGAGGDTDVARLWESLENARKRGRDSTHRTRAYRMRSFSVDSVPTTPR